MGSIAVDQLLADGSVVQDVDHTLSEREKVGLLTRWLPGAEPRRIGAQRYVRFQDRALLYKQVTHLGRPWAAYKKRIQVPKGWLEAHAALVRAGLRPHFIGIYHHGDVTVFVDFDPETYLRRKANNSAAHVATNDLHQALAQGSFTRVDKNDNRLTSVRSSDLATYLSDGPQDDPLAPFLDPFKELNRTVLTGRSVTVLDAAAQMHAAGWRHAFQAEWAGFYLEHLLDAHLRARPAPTAVELVQQKASRELDFDLVFRDRGGVSFLGDLKASDERGAVAPGNDAVSLERALATHGRFWYVVYEHSTVKARDQGDVATVAWNTWRRDVGYVAGSGKAFDPLSYSRRLKAEVTFTRMMVLEVNPANQRLVLGQFNQGRQPSGAPRAPKVLINKAHVENFIVYGERLGQRA